MPKVVAVVNGKGGVAKTTTAFNLAAIFSKRYKVLLLDTDPQGSATWWAGQRGTEQQFTVVQEQNPELLSQMKKIERFDLIVCDTPPHLGSKALDTIVKASDYVVLPTPPEPMDLVALIDTVNDSVAPTGVRHRVVLTKVDPRRMSDALDAQINLREAEIPVFSTVVRMYAAHGKASIEGLPILDWKGKNAKEARSDYLNVADELQREWN